MKSVLDKVSCTAQAGLEFTMLQVQGQPPRLASEYSAPIPMCLGSFCFLLM